jgi:FtsP/CotA-like multicopper oxidase with cupredoxin domain
LIELATLVVTGKPSSGRIPTPRVDPPRIPKVPVARRRTLRFRTDLSGRAGLGVIGYVDEKTFDPDRIDQRVEAGTVEEWTIRNADVMQHPIHIHINPFQVVDVQGIPSGDTSGRPIRASGGIPSGYHRAGSSRCAPTSGRTPPASGAPATPTARHLPMW